MRNVKELLGELNKVYDCDNLTKIRIGNRCDGGYIALKELCEDVKEVYSFGVGSDVGFEIYFANRFPKANIKLFDPTIESLPMNHQRFSFFKYNIIQGYDRLREISNGDSLMKMDIEWDEWEAFWLFDSETLSKFSQIVVEFHIIHVEPRKCLTPYFINFYQRSLDKINEEVLFDLYRNVMRKLNKLFYIFHIHANNSLPKIDIGRYSFPPLLEISFIRKDLVAGNVRETKGNFPVEGLDFPNKSDREDFHDWFPI